MKSTHSPALVSPDSFDERLRNVFSLRAAIPVLDEYLSSIQIDDDHPGFVLSWDLNNLTAFVAAANALNPARAPDWLQTLPPQITVNSFTDDLVQELLREAGSRCGRFLLAPNTLGQFGAVAVTLAARQNNDFMQDAARAALPRSVLNNLPPARRNNERLRRIFI
ncbi:hypothetical protein PHYSODRAFT_320139 [Phytophthora sojae]|uniref:Uncharacterized protein n=1 Tax=Phytophthora sojae (strain P6497) TaxID=1094619 RepID=G5AG30_PHYSP|nr:hypothetical protein PHYSODRAFT_320139 [Phytophthora sojae]EGZ05542.1 hypothetical protein PHYSODRAFT_320139 [Phytophthora sojae]|eukprot:XP_009539073.1 hypothetical protein PHYSODRAFT_320139 [Phytophthora sojae]